MSALDNRLIEQLPEKDRAHLLALCEPVELALSQLLCCRGQPSDHVYFPTGSIISLVTRTGTHPGLEVGMVGSEGMLGVQLGLGFLTSPLHALVQGPGAAWRVQAAAFRDELGRSVALKTAINRYLYVLVDQLATSAACLRFHMIGPRLACWLLMRQDRADSARFHVTHEFLACMLGVRRVGITMAAGALQRAGLIEYHRGEIEVLDRGGLEAAACSCYAINRRHYLEIRGERIPQ